MKMMDGRPTVRYGKSEPARLAITVSTGWIRSPKRSMILSSQLRSASASCELRSRQLVDALGDMGQGRGQEEERGVVGLEPLLQARRVRRRRHLEQWRCPSTRWSRRSPSSFRQKSSSSGYGALRSAWRNAAASESGFVSSAGLARFLRLDGVLRQRPDHRDGLTIVGDEAALAVGGGAHDLGEVSFGLADAVFFHLIAPVD